jgi:catechol 2,3-dioxygenase-like lactoylglutathione lyase family enzyme
MRQTLMHVALVVRDYDEAIEFFFSTPRFALIEDTYQPEQDKGWVVVAPPLAAGISFLGEPQQAPYGTVTVFEDLYANHWDLVERAKDQPA